MHIQCCVCNLFEPVRGLKPHFNLNGKHLKGKKGAVYSRAWTSLGLVDLVFLSQHTSFCDAQGPRENQYTSCAPHPWWHRLAEDRWSVLLWVTTGHPGKYCTSRSPRFISHLVMLSMCPFSTIWWYKQALNIDFVLCKGASQPIMSPFNDLSCLEAYFGVRQAKGHLHLLHVYAQSMTVECFVPQLAGVQYVLDTVIYALLANPNRKFSYAEMVSSSSSRHASYLSGRKAAKNLFSLHRPVLDSRKAWWTI